MKQQILEARLAQIEAIARQALAIGTAMGARTSQHSEALSEILLLCERWRAER